MTKTYKVTMPTPERCTELGIKFEGLYSRTQMWLTGVSCGVSYVSGYHTQLIFPTKSMIQIGSNSSVVLNNIKDRLEAYGFTFEVVDPNLIPAPAKKKLPPCAHFTF